MTGAIRVTPWPDPVLDVLGHDPRSWYVETFWLPTLGPTALLLLRHLADRFERTPEGVELPVADTAAALGLGPREGSSSPLDPQPRPAPAVRARLHRRRATIAVRRTLPPVHRRHVRRLPAALQAEHEEWIAGQRAAPVDLARRRARRVALMLVAQGETDRHRRARAARRRLPSRARARSRALGARPPTRARHRHRPRRDAVSPRGGVGRRYRHPSPPVAARRGGVLRAHPTPALTRHMRAPSCGPRSRSSPSRSSRSRRRLQPLVGEDGVRARIVDDRRVEPGDGRRLLRQGEGRGRRVRHHGDRREDPRRAEAHVPEPRAAARRRSPRRRPPRSRATSTRS